MTYKGYKACLEYDGDDECFIGHLAGIDDLVGFHAPSAKDLKIAFSRRCGRLYRDLQEGGQAAGGTRKSLNQWAEEVLRQAAKSSSRM
jgi:predicted HicB family RNase H-like nuclease